MFAYLKTNQLYSENKTIVYLKAKRLPFLKSQRSQESTYKPKENLGFGGSFALPQFQFPGSILRISKNDIR